MLIIDSAIHEATKVSKVIKPVMIQTVFPSIQSSAITATHVTGTLKTAISKSAAAKFRINRLLWSVVREVLPRCKIVSHCQKGSR